jgi:RNA recognition motif-containing protein
MKLFVGNFSLEVTEEELKKAFEPFGEIASVVIIKEKNSDESRGFGFVEMPSQTQAQAAIAALNGKEWMGRMLNVNEARPRPQFRQDSFRKGSGRQYDSRKRGGKRRDGKRRSRRGF